MIIYGLSFFTLVHPENCGTGRNRWIRQHRNMSYTRWQAWIFFIFHWTSPVHPVFLLLSTPPYTHASLKPLFFSRLTQKEKKERSGEAFGGWALQKQQPWWAQACSSVIVSNMTNCEKTRRHKSPLQWNFISCGCSHAIRWRQGVDAESGCCSWHRIDLSVCVRVCGCIGLSVCH